MIALPRSKLLWFGNNKETANGKIKKLFTGLHYLGKPVQVRHGPAAVTGDESHRGHCSFEWEGVASRMIRKSEDLPVQYEAYVPGDGRYADMGETGC